MRATAGQASAGCLITRLSTMAHSHQPGFALAAGLAALGAGLLLTGRASRRAGEPPI